MQTNTDQYLCQLWSKFLIIHLFLLGLFIYTLRKFIDYLLYGKLAIGDNDNKVSTFKALIF